MFLREVEICYDIYDLDCISGHNYNTTISHAFHGVQSRSNAESTILGWLVTEVGWSYMVVWNLRVVGLIRRRKVV